MRRYFCAGLAVLMLAACNQSGPEPTVAVPAAPTTTSPEPVAPVFNPEFPTGFEPTFAYKIRSKKTEETPEGRVRRLVIEFKEGDVATVDKAIESALASKGFRRYKTFDQDGGIVGDYGNNGQRVTVTSSPVSDKLVLDADSLGTVYFIWKE